MTEGSVSHGDPRTTGEGTGSRFGAVFSRSLNPMLVADDERRYVDANQAACLLLRMTRAEVLSHRIDDLTPTEIRPRLDEAWREFVEGGNQDGTWEFALPDGSSISVRYSATANVEPGLHLSMFFFGDAAEEDDGEGAEPWRAATLTPRERELLTMVALGSSGEQIATELVLSPETVRTHLRNARRKLGARSRAHAVALALQRGEIEL
jgi:PAS domain S-box-containing protein